MRRTLAMITAAIATFVLLAAPAAAQTDPYEGDTGGITTDNPNPVVGSQVNIFGHGCDPGSTVTILVGGVVVGTTVADANGDFTFVITAPGTPGPAEVTAQCGVETFSLTLNVVAAAAGASGQLPTTGSDAFPLVKIGAVLMGAGAIAVLAARRQRRPATVATNS